VVANKNGVLLTYRRIPPAGKWHLPGGTVLFGETQDEAVKRVCLEELGVDAKIEKLLGVINFDPKKNKESIGHGVSVAYKIELEGVIQLNEQASKYKFFKNSPTKIFKEHKDFLSSRGYFNGSN
jgi:ADP-ribose pyrophosphatase YjhB (NUDIX family)